MACILRYFNNAEGDAGIPWSKAAQFAVQPLSLLGLIGLGNDDVYITDAGKEFLAIPSVKEKFNTEFEKDISKWKQLSPAVINKGAAEMLQANTKTLQSMGPSVEHYITP